MQHRALFYARSPPPGAAFVDVSAQSTHTVCQSGLNEILAEILGRIWGYGFTQDNQEDFKQGFLKLK